MGGTSKDAAAIKALQELGLRKNADPNSLSDQIKDIEAQLNDYNKYFDHLDPSTLEKYLKSK